MQQDTAKQPSVARQLAHLHALNTLMQVHAVNSFFLFLFMIHASWLMMHTELHSHTADNKQVYLGW